MNFLSQEVDDRLDINVTPLIDIVFLLLIFLMLTTSFSEGPQIEVDLPKASAQASKEEAKSLTISINANGEIFSGKDALDLAGLKALLAQEKSEKLSLIVRADKATDHGEVVSVMDVASQVGIQDLAIATNN